MSFHVPLCVFMYNNLFIPEPFALCTKTRSHKLRPKKRISYAHFQGLLAFIWAAYCTFLLTLPLAERMKLLFSTWTEDGLPFIHLICPMRKESTIFFRFVFFFSQHKTARRWGISFLGCIRSLRALYLAVHFPFSSAGFSFSIPSVFRTCEL